jgi:glycosyltransferase involved in cell wall biosynthesis
MQDCRPKHDLQLSKNCEISAIRAAETVLVDNRSAHENALQYLGLRKTSVVQLPLLISKAIETKHPNRCIPSKCFLVILNEYSDAIFRKIFSALRIYFTNLNGAYECKIMALHSVGVSSEFFSLQDTYPNAWMVVREFENKVSFVDEALYEGMLSQAAFIWFPDPSGTALHGVIEAASFGVPILCAESPPARDIENQLDIGVKWTHASDRNAIALKIKEMEAICLHRSHQIPLSANFAEFSVGHKCGAYWKAIRECL